MFTLTILALSVCHSNNGLYMGGGPSDYVCQGEQTIDLPTQEACRTALKGTDLYGKRQYESADVVITDQKIAYCAPKKPEPKTLEFSGASITDGGNTLTLPFTAPNNIKITP